MTQNDFFVLKLVTISGETMWLYIIIYYATLFSSVSCTLYIQSIYSIWDEFSKLILIFNQNSKIYYFY